MPNYEYFCIKCGAKDYEVRTVEERNDEKICKKVIEYKNLPPGIDKSEVCMGFMKLKIGNPPFRITV